ncbi:uncharacterized protein LAJ45_00394 [Morchella importuna]|uniref:uncharacterized protein n=1 Tax=Morchella importuna TaxID=1174673 RepID=UPI001E8DEDA2|nr:uncharacterized protein LAJ45_00394 [Morchella importuna]KAH8155384.1 hypothetical protein LAJ45_00394 [Morchella importuna]
MGVWLGLEIAWRALVFSIGFGSSWPEDSSLILRNEIKIYGQGIIYYIYPSPWGSYMVSKYTWIRSFMPRSGPNKNLIFGEHRARSDSKPKD